MLSVSKTQKYINLRCEHPYMFNKRKSNPKIGSNSTSYGSIRGLFGKSKASETTADLRTIYNDDRSLDRPPHLPRYTTLSNRRIDVNTSIVSRDPSEPSELPDIPISRDSVNLTQKDIAPVTLQDQDELDHLEHLENMKKLKKIRNSVRSVDKFNPLPRKRLYNGIVIISQKEFFIDIFKTKAKCYISAIELSTKKPYMIELHSQVLKKLLKE